MEWLLQEFSPPFFFFPARYNAREPLFYFILRHNNIKSPIKRESAAACNNHATHLPPVSRELPRFFTHTRVFLFFFLPLWALPTICWFYANRVAPEAPEINKIVKVSCICKSHTHTRKYLHLKELREREKNKLLWNNNRTLLIIYHLSLVYKDFIPCRSIKSQCQSDTTSRSYKRIKIWENQPIKLLWKRAIFLHDHIFAANCRRFFILPRVRLAQWISKWGIRGKGLVRHERCQKMHKPHQSYKALIVRKYLSLIATLVTFVANETMIIPTNW